MKKTMCAVAFVLAATIALPGCSGGGSAATSTVKAEPKKGGDLIVGALPASIDPMATTQRIVGLLAAQACEGLFASTSTLGVKDGLVEAWTYDGTKVYDLKLRKNVPFQDGTTMKAPDVVSSLQRYASSAPGATFGGLVDNITAQGDYDVHINLKSPSGAIPALLATPDTAAYIMPAKFLQGHPVSDALQSLVCTGPYKLDSYTPDQSAKFSRFDAYVPRTDESDGAAGAKTAYVDTITFIPTNSSNAANLLKAGQLDVQSQFPLDQVQTLTGSGVSPVVIENGSFPLIQFNTRAGAMANVKLRQAAQAALNDEKIMAATAPSAKYYSLDSSLMPKGSPWYSQAGAKYYNQNDDSLSQKLQKEAGYSGQTLTLLYQPTDTFSPVVVEELKKAGFVINAQQLDSATFAARRKDPKKWDMFISGGTSYGDPLTVVFMSAGFPGWWNSPEKQALIADFTAGATQEKRKASWDKLQGLIYDQVPFIRLGGRAQVDATGQKVAKYPPQIGSARGFYNVYIK